MLPLGSMAGTIESAADFLLPRHGCVSRDKTAQEAIEETGKKQVDDAPAGLILRLDAQLKKLQYENYSDAEE
ncbi:hypothetical protein DLJ82_6789 (plasmid) [Rhizobium leguminosarum]|uniref:Uncharacterized protein n=2 Tax=Rhizobium leguminosarum TaxID=384 RepID=A0A2Z4YUI1_RHILE|nr:hypothetical protein DLJ82_6789 [Rhizobium leguminosarum]